MGKKLFQLANEKLASLSKQELIFLLESLGFRANRYGLIYSPFREERNASVSLFFSGQTWRFKDHGDGRTGDILDLIRFTRQCSLKDAAEIVLNALSEDFELEDTLEVTSTEKPPQKPSQSVSESFSIASDSQTPSQTPNPSEANRKPQKPRFETLYETARKNAKPETVIKALQAHGFIDEPRRLVVLYHESELLISPDGNNIGYPFRTPSGEIVGFFWRNLEGVRYAYVGRKGLMPLNRSSSKKLIIVEGIRDLLATALLNPNSIVAFAGNPSEQQLEFLKDYIRQNSFEKITFALDNDSAGRDLAKRIFDHIQDVIRELEISFSRANLPAESDPFDVYIQHRKQRQRPENKTCKDCGFFPREVGHLSTAKVCRATQVTTWADMGACEYYADEEYYAEDDDFDFSP